MLAVTYLSYVQLLKKHSLFPQAHDQRLLEGGTSGLLYHRIRRGVTSQPAVHLHHEPWVPSAPKPLPRSRKGERKRDCGIGSRDSGVEVRIRDWG
jgi:hypothetical protein